MKHRPTKTDAAHYEHPLDVVYDGEHHPVASFEAAWVLAWEHVPSTIVDLTVR